MIMKNGDWMLNYWYTRFLPWMLCAVGAGACCLWHSSLVRHYLDDPKPETILVRQVAAPEGHPLPDNHTFDVVLDTGYLIQVRPIDPDENDFPSDEISVYKLIGHIHVGEDEITVHNCRKVGSIRMDNVLDQWLKNEESLWGSHGTANQIRYQRNYAGGNVAGLVTQLTPHGSYADVTIQWRLRGASAHDFQAGHNARLVIEPEVKLTVIVTQQ
jgi:hypothetical protein